MIIPDYDNTVSDIGCATFKYSIIRIFKTKIPKATVSTLIIYYLHTPSPTAVSSHNKHLQIFIFKVLPAEFHLHCIPTIFYQSFHKPNLTF